MLARLGFFFLAICVFPACKENRKQAGGPIILGDSSTIVTETDPRFLSDYVDDIQLQTPPPDTSVAVGDTAATATPQDTLATVAPPPPDPGPGLKIAFDEVTVFIPGIQTRTYGSNPVTAHGASYELVAGDLDGNKLQLTGATITRVQQRYRTEVWAKTSLGSLELDALGQTTNWMTIDGDKQGYAIWGLKNPVFRKVSPAQIRSAVNRAARNKRMSRQSIRKWEAAVRNARSVTQKPLQAAVRSVMWKIEGRDSRGRGFQKQVRIDIPLN